MRVSKYVCLILAVGILIFLASGADSADRGAFQKGKTYLLGGVNNASIIQVLESSDNDWVRVKVIRKGLSWKNSEWQTGKECYINVNHFIFAAEVE